MAAHLTLISDLADIEPVAQEIEQRSPLKWDATADAASCKQPCLGADVAFLKISNQGIDAAKFPQSAREHGRSPDVLRLMTRLNLLD